MSLSMVFDRTQVDVDYAKEVILSGALSYGDLKGCHEVSDLNRVEEACATLAGIFAQAGYIVDVTTKLWSESSVRTDAEFERMMTNVYNLRQCVAVLDGTPDAPMMGGGVYGFEPFTFTLANDLEEILFNVSVVTDYITSPLYYLASGDTSVVSGGVDAFTAYAGKVNSTRAMLTAQATMLENYTWATLSEDATSSALATAEMQQQVDDVVDNGIVSAVSYVSNVGQTGSYSFVVVLEANGISLTTSAMVVDVAETEFVPNVEFLDSIVSDGVACINTMLYPQGGVTEVYTEFTNNLNRTVAIQLMGARNATVMDVDSCQLRISTSNALRLDWDNNSTNITNVVGTRYTLNHTTEGTTVNDTFYARSGNSGTRLTAPFYLFCAYNISSDSLTTPATNLEIHIVKIGENGEWLRNLVPVRILDTSEVCMYDYITQTYYKNVAGSGSFTGVSKSVPEYGYVDIVSDLNTTLLLKSVDGAIVDSSYYEHEITNVGAVVNDEGFTLGASSGYLYTDETAFDVSGDWTVEWIETANGSTSVPITCIPQSITTHLQCLLLSQTGTQLYASSNDTAWDIASGTVIKTFTVGVETLWAIQLKSNVLTVYKDGSVYYTMIFANNLYVGSNTILLIGAFINVSNTFIQGYNATIKQLKISNIARYDGDYTPSDDTWIM